jgi:hypothetical protein
MPSSGQLKKQRIRFWNEDPTCDWCGIITILPENVDSENSQQVARMATIDHLRNRTHVNRLESPNNTTRHVLACNRCNWLRNVLTELPSIGIITKRKNWTRL